MKGRSAACGKSLESADRPITHLIAIERVSPAADGKPHREHGWDMSRETAPLHLLFDDPTWQRRWTTIGIGDGGNEIGMGSLPQNIVETEIPNGRMIAATTPADYLIVAGVSNWGGYGLLAAMACLRPQKAAASAAPLQSRDGPSAADRGRRDRTGGGRQPG